MEQGEWAAAEGELEEEDHGQVALDLQEKLKLQGKRIWSKVHEIDIRLRQRLCRQSSFLTWFRNIQGFC